MEDEVSLSEAVAGPGPGHNRLQVVLDSATLLGGQSALGGTALLQLGMTVIEAAHDGIVRPETATAIAQHYADGCKNADGTPGSVKTNASKLRKLIELGKLNDGPKLAKDALRVRENIENPKSPFETLVPVVRHCLKSKSCELADDEIGVVIAKAPPKKNSKAKTSDWQSVAIQVCELIAVKDEDGLRAAHAIRAQLNNYLKDDSEEVRADQPAQSPHDVPTMQETTEVDEAAHTPPAVTVEVGGEHPRRNT